MPNLVFVSCGEFHWPFLKPVNQIWPVGACAGPGRLTGVAASPRGLRTGRPWRPPVIVCRRCRNSVTCVQFCPALPVRAPDCTGCLLMGFPAACAKLGQVFSPSRMNY